MSETKTEAVKNVYQRLAEVQYEIRVPKDRSNDFGKYKFRNAEDIQAAARQPLHDAGAVIVLRDHIVHIEGVKHMKSIAHFINIDNPSESIAVPGLAEMADSKGGMSKEQVTGSSSSYARKYALSALLAIGSDEDDDSINKAGKGAKAPSYGDNERAKTWTPPNKAPSKPAPKVTTPRKEVAKTSALDDPEGAGAVAFDEEKKILEGKKKLIAKLMPDAKTKQDFETAFELILDKKTIDTVAEADEMIKALSVELPA